MGRWVALSGTPGAGKSSVARHLPAAWSPVEVADLARRLGVSRRSPFGPAVVDLDRLRGRFPPPAGPVQCLVGHLAHLLPLRDVFLLRCHPIELERRLGGARRASPRARNENMVSEAIDLILEEALERRRRVWEVDTTGRTPAEVARTIIRLFRTHTPPHWGEVDWLSDPSVTDSLLRRAR